MASRGTSPPTDVREVVKEGGGERERTRSEECNGAVRMVLYNRATPRRPRGCRLPLNAVFLFVFVIPVMIIKWDMLGGHDSKRPKSPDT
jgi:hypothetical protein